jgi:hypothetical protein
MDNLDYLNDIISAPNAFPGGYRKWALMDDGEVMCAEAVREEQDAIRESDGRDGWSIVDVFVHWEGEPLTCCHSGRTFDSEYGRIDD